MAIVRMQKVAILAHKEKSEELIARLQEEGAVEVTPAGKPRPVDHAESKFRIAEIDFAIRTLTEVAPKDVLRQASITPLPDEIAAAAWSTDVHGIVERLHELHAEDAAMERELSDIHARIAELTPWLGLKESLPPLQETATCRRVFGFIPTEALQRLRNQLDSVLPRTCLETAGEGLVSAIVWKVDMARFEELATTYGWTTVRPPEGNRSPGELRAKLLRRQHEIVDAVETHRAERVLLSMRLPDLIKTRMFTDWLKARAAVRDSTGSTDTMIVIEGWIPAKAIPKLERALSSITSAIAIVPVEPKEDDLPPVLLKNSRLIAPFESVTTLYGLPLSSEVDPTTSLAPFFALFFALCLTDSGYGLALTLLMGGYLWHTKQSIRRAPLWWAVLFGGIATFFVGIPFGGWFGLSANDLPQALDFLRKPVGDGYWFRGQIWNLGTSEGVSLLQNLALILGLTHLFFGMFIAGWHKWTHGRRASAFWEHFTNHIMLGAVLFRVFAPEALTQIATYALYGALALLVWGKGYGTAWHLRPVMGFLGTVNFAIGLLSNSLSYLRILALGLVTGAIALAVNQVAFEIGKLFPLWIGIPVIIVVAVCGHAVSIALNTLGSFIHAGRLQFIEFFGQFFEGGGKPFTPFNRSSR